ncbi:MAG: hypothetical protein HGA19_11545, partial [Oscillochloris sp.]|nr:hypothetical protein [Oscillochloris sp.]
MADISIYFDKAFETQEFADLAEAPVDALAGISAADAAALKQALNIVMEIGHQQGAKLIAKSKTMIREEIGLNHTLEKHGFQVFREIEQRVAHDFCRNFSGILATGSATIENSKNLQNLKKTGIFVFV